MSTDPSAASTSISFPSAPGMPMPSPGQTHAPLLPEAYYLGTTILTGAVPPRLPNYSPEKDVTAIRDACHGIGTNDGKLIKVLVAKTAMQTQVLQVAYKQQRQKDLIALLENETSGVYKAGLVMLASGPLGGDAYALKQALKSQNRQTQNAILTDLVVCKSKDELALFRNYLFATQHLDLDHAVSAAVADENKTVQEIFAECLKHEVTREPLDPEHDFQAIKQSLSINSQDRAQLYPVLLSRPPVYLNHLLQRWCQETFNQTLAESISLHFQNDSAARDLFLHAIGAAESVENYGFGVWRDAQGIEDAISKRNELLLTVRLIRAHWDQARFQAIVAACNALKPGKAKLEDRLSSVTSGNLKALLKELID